MRAEQIGALGGVAFVVLALATFLFSGSLPAPDASADEISEWLADNANGIQASALLVGLGSAGLLWWFGSLWRRTVEAENGQPNLSVVALSGLLLSGALYLVSMAITSGMAMRNTEGGGATVLWAMSGVAVSLANVGVAVLVSAVSVLSLRAKLFPAWIGYLGCAVAVVSLVASGGAASDASFFFYVGLPGFLGWLVWILGISWELWRTPAAASA